MDCNSLVVSDAVAKIIEHVYRYHQECNDHKYDNYNHAGLDALSGIVYLHALRLLARLLGAKYVLELKLSLCDAQGTKNLLTSTSLQLKTCKSLSIEVSSHA